MTNRWSPTRWAIVLMIAACGTARSADNYQYVIDATNHISSLNSQALSPAPEDLAKANAEACQTLTQLVKDDAFRKAMETAKQKSAETRADRKGLKRDLKVFVDVFLRPEQDALKKAGLNDDALRQTALSAQLLRQDLDDDNDPARIIASVTAFQRDVCRDAGTLSKTADDTARRRALQKLAFRIGGIGVIVVDAFFVPTALVSAGSVAIGSGMMAFGQ